MSDRPGPGSWWRRPAPSTLRVLAATSVLAVLGFVIVGLLHDRDPLPAGAPMQFTGSWLLMLAAFASAESIVLRLRVMQHEQIVTIAELPFALGLVILRPDVLIAVRLAGGLLSFIAVRRRLSLKVVFNASLWLAEAGVASATFGLVADDHTAWGPRLWLAIVAAVIAGPGLLSSVATTVVIGAFEGHIDAGEALRAAAEQVVTSLVLVVPAVVFLDVVHGTRQGLALVLPMLVLLVAVYRYIASLHERHAALLRVHAFTHELNSTADPEGVLRVVLEQVRVLLGVTHVEVCVRRPGGGDMLAAALTRQGVLTMRRVEPTEPDAATLLPPARHPLTGVDARRLRRRGAGADDAAWLTQRHLREAILAPLPTADGPIGSLIAGAAMGEVRSFTTDDLRLLSSVGEQVSVAIRHAELLEQLQHTSEHDPLTGLANRDLFHRAAEASLETSTTSVLSIDLDGFKEVNDAFGHAHGDAILVEMGRRLAELFPAPATTARLGGDEFAVLLPGAEDADAMVLANRLRGILEVPVEVQGDHLAVGASVGVATVPRRTNPEVVLQRADLAMYAAKRSDHGPRGWEPRLEGRTAGRTPLLGELREALRSGEIGIALQPQISPVGGAFVAVEALVRWSLASGPVPPEQLVATAERGGMMTDLTLHVLDRALASTVELERQGRQLEVSVNVSTRDLSSDRLVEGVRDMLARHRLAPHRLTLELTETGILLDIDRATEVMTQLKAVGVRLSLDDFGIGWSSLQQLKRLPFDEIKIDRSFLGDLVSDPGAAEIVRSVLTLGRGLGLRVVAEGVEDAATLSWLELAGCDRAQGYHIARPMNHPALVEFAKQARWRPELVRPATLTA